MNRTHFYIFALLGTLFFTVQCGKSPARGADSHSDEEVKERWTAYSERFELFAEADPLVVGKECSILAHFTWLTDFKPLTEGRITASLQVNGQTVATSQPKPLRPGIFRFTIVPKAAGKGRLSFDIAAQGGDGIRVDDIQVFQTMDDARNALAGIATPQGVVFTKEMSWKVDFATDLPRCGVFQEVIRTTAQIQSAQGDEVIVTAKADGVVRFFGEPVVEGRSLKAGQSLFSIAGSGVAENNLAVRFAEARNDYARAQGDYQRAKDLIQDRIVSEKELLKAQNEYENAKTVFESLAKDFSAGAKIVASPFAGFVKQVFVQNGQHVTSGQPIVTVSQNRKLLLRADVRQQYAPRLGSIVSATIRIPSDNRTYTMEQLNGRFLSFGQSVNEGNFMIPVSLMIDNLGGLMPGLFVELFLKTAHRSEALSLPLSAIIEEQGNTFVFVQADPELFVKREVRLGSTDGLDTEILTGIEKTERVVTRGAILVKLAQASGALDAHSGHTH